MVRVSKLALLLVLVVGLAEITLASEAMRFRVRYENVTSGEILTGSKGMRAPLAVAPGLWVVASAPATVFMTGEMDGGKGLEPLAEDGDPSVLKNSLMGKDGVAATGVFTTPVGADKAGPITPGNSFEFEFEGAPGQKLFLANMWGQSNDLFFATNELGIPLFDKMNKPVSGDITDHLFLYDAGTEVNEEPGFGPNQGPRQSGRNTGVAERGIVRPVQDGWTYPVVRSSIKVTITPVMKGGSK